MTLQKLIPTRNRFTEMKAFAICANSSHDSTVQIRGNGIHLIFDIASGKQLYGPQLPNATLVQQWVSDEKEELLRCWSEAVDVYYRFYPHEKPVA